jgi:2-dehydro-3-deoxygluconokinase
VTRLGVLGEGLAELSVDGAGATVALAFGGDAANVAVMAARAGAAARIAGRVGDDGLGHALLAFWARQGIDTASVIADPEAATGLYLNDADAARGHRLTYWRAGSAGSRLAPGDVGAAFLDGLDVLVVTGVTLSISATAHDAARDAARHVRRAGGRVAFVLNHRPALKPRAGDLADFAAGSDVVIGSREDAVAVFGTGDPYALAALFGGDREREVVLTDEGRPARVLHGGHWHRQDVPAVTVANAAGAGDALAGAYLAARLHGHAPDASLRRAVAAASLSVQRPGCAASYPDAAEIDAMLDHMAVGA